MGKEIWKVAKHWGFERSVLKATREEAVRRGGRQASGVRHQASDGGGQQSEGQRKCRIKNEKCRMAEK